MKKLLLHSFVLLFIITLFALVLRTYKISVNPPSLSWDEVSIGYNAYSILKTGRDEHGKILPLDVFVAYGDYKPPLSIYITVPFVAVFGLNEFAVRLPSAIFGTFTVLLTFFFVKELLRQRQETMNKRRDALSHADCLLSFDYLPFLSSFLLAISPWHINLSRAGFEANIALFFVVLGLYLMLLGRRKSICWIIAFIPFVFAMYTFNSSRYVAPFLGLGCLFYCREYIKKHFREICIGLVCAAILLLPIIPHLVSKEARLRFAEVNIFTDASVVETSNKRMEEAGNVWWSKIVYNRRVGYARSYILHFFDHFEPAYLFVKGDGNPKFSIQDVGQLYMIEAPFLIIGMYGVLTSHVGAGLFLLYWLLVSIIPAAAARETPHALRTLNSLPTWQIFTAYGIMVVSLWVKHFSEKHVRIGKIVFISYCITLVGFYGISFSYYIHSYYSHYPKEYSGEWQYGYREALQYVSPIEKNYDTVYMTENIGRPYMYALFYKHTDPNEFFRTKDSSFDAAGFYHVYGFGKYRFFTTMPNCNTKCIVIAPVGTEMKDGKLLKTISLLNGNPVLNIFEKIP